MSSPLHGAAYIQMSSRVAHCARQSSNFAPGSEMKEPQSHRPSPQIWICASGNQMRFILKSHHHHHHPTDCTQASQVLPGWASEDLLHPNVKVRGKDSSKPREIQSDERHWKCSWLQRETFARAKDDLQRIHKSSQIRAEFPRR